MWWVYKCFVQNLNPGVRELSLLCPLGASSSSCLDTKVPRFFLSEEKELKALWRREQASLCLCHLWSWQRGHGTNGVKFQPCSDPLSSLCPHPLEPGCWVGPGLAPPAPTPGTSPRWKLPEPWCLISPASSHRLPGSRSASVGSPCLPALCQSTDASSLQGPPPKMMSHSWGPSLISGCPF